MFEQAFVPTRSIEMDFVALQDSLLAFDPTVIVWVQNERLVRATKSTVWTAPQIASAQNLIDTAPELTPTRRYTNTSRGKDMLATAALVVRSRDIAGWNAMTAQQKKQAVLAEADVWVSMRQFIEANT